jgi:YidC/Oxa1 family membrane protein insertase
MIALYNTLIYYPLLNLLVYLYNFIPDIGVVIVLLTVLIRLALAPSFHKSLKSQKALAELQPKINELREKFKNDQQAQAQAMMQLYKDYKINPLSSCLPLLVQLPFLIAIYQVFSKALGNHLTGLYSFVTRPENINPMFLNILDLSKPNLILGILAGAAQFWQSKIMQSQQSQAAQDPTAKAIGLQTTYILPLISVIIAVRLPAGLPLYWLVTTLFSVAQQYWVLKKPQALP